MKHAVVYDLELVKRFKKGQPSEIVEIGACKVDLTTRQVIENFQIYIVPGSGYFSKSTRSFINMTKEDAAGAVSFKTGIRQFADWTGPDSYLCSWGKDDKLHIVNECVRKNIPLGWFRNYNDIQSQIGRLLSDQKGQMGLKNALALAGIEPVGKAHRGIDDARNTAELLIRFADRLKLEENELTERDLNPPPRDPDKRRSRTRRPADGTVPEAPNHAPEQATVAADRRGHGSADAAGSTPAGSPERAL
ncbi:exonuclease domain-containing protein [Gorillibacterium sp. sgz5001074]|uniref:exonuclease domain-containing protein n=1 Tax=Gorillibacterium sp. sgz5001074 TaxID=3446695 RepID=UPI003F67D86D